MRFAIWCAVSTKPQAEDDKDSLPVQEETCRKSCLSHGWEDTGLRYIVPGQSRTRFVNLRDAEHSMPALAAALNDAQSGRYDLLALYDYSRLRDLADPVAKTLIAYGVQLYSISQPSEPIPPETFRPETSDSEPMLRGLNQIIGRWQLSDLRRKYRFGVSARVQRGLHSLGFPYGYLRAIPGDPSSPLLLDPLPASLITRIKDAFLAGSTLSQLRALADSSGVHPQRIPAWSRASIYAILRNPFYAGKVTFGKVRTSLDPRTGQRHKTLNGEPPLIHDGLHPPLWDWPTHLAILAELTRRQKGSPRAKARPLSGLLTCSICGAKLTQRLKYFRCHTAGAKHISLPYRQALADIPPLLADELRRLTPDLAPGPAPDHAPALADLARRRARITDGYEAGLYDLPAAQAKLTELQQQTQSLQDTQNEHARRIAERDNFIRTLTDIQTLLDRLPLWLTTDDPRKVNLLLHRLLTHITVTPAPHTYTFHFRS